MLNHRRAKLIVSGSLLVAFTTAWSVFVYRHTANFPLDPTKESTFLRGYSEDRVVQSFWQPSFNYGLESGESHGAGHNSVTNQRSVGATFVMCRAGRFTATSALEDDVVAQLRQHGATILRLRRDADRKLRVAYRLGNDVGIVSVSPVRVAESVRRNMSLPDGLEDMTTSVTIEETWYTSDASATLASGKVLSEPVLTRP